MENILHQLLKNILVPKKIINLFIKYYYFIAFLWTLNFEF